MIICVDLNIKSIMILCVGLKHKETIIIMCVGIKLKDDDMHSFQT